MCIVTNTYKQNSLPLPWRGAQSPSAHGHGCSTEQGGKKTLEIAYPPREEGRERGRERALQGGRTVLKATPVMNGKHEECPEKVVPWRSLLPACSRNQECHRTTQGRVYHTKSPAFVVLIAGAVSWEFTQRRHSIEDSVQQLSPQRQKQKEKVQEKVLHSSS